MRDITIISMNVNQNHWIGVEIDSLENKISVYDPMQKRRMKTSQWAKKLIENLNSIYPKKEFTWIPETPGPTQPDATSCGLYVSLFFGEKYSDEFANWTAQDPTFWRIHFLKEIFSRKIE